MGGEAGAPFERRKEDANYAAISTRVTIVERLVETLKLEVSTLSRQSGEMKGEIQANTRLTEDIHGTTSSMQQKTDEMYAAFDSGRNAIRVITKTGDMLVRSSTAVSDVIEKRKTTIVLAILAGGAAWGLYFGKMPDWLGLVAKLFV